MDLVYGDQMLIKTYLFAYSVDKAIMPTCRAPGWGCCWWSTHSRAEAESKQA